MAAKNKNNIEGLNGGQPLLDGNINNSFITKSANGQQVGAFYLLEMTGIFLTEDEIAKSAPKRCTSRRYKIFGCKWGWTNHRR